MLRRQVISFKQTFLLICLIISLVTSKIEKNNRKRRDILNSNSFLTIYYICGTYPSTILSIIPCQTCRNGGKDLYLPCTNPIQCIPYHRSTTACIDGRCCTSRYDNSYDNNNPYGGNLYNNGNPYIEINNNNPYNGNNLYDNSNNLYRNNDADTYNSNLNNPYYEQERNFGYCPRGERSNIRCSAPGQCPNAQICLNGMCCPQSNNDYMHCKHLEACGGQMAITSCQKGNCMDGLICTASKFCCQCYIGRSGGRCNQGVCAPGYICNLNDYCCASCPGNQTPFGTCTNQQLCASRFHCSFGDICCPDNLFYNNINYRNNLLARKV